MCSDLVVIHDRNVNLETLSHEISSLLGVKLSKAKEHHAKAFGCKSYNSLLSALNKSPERAVHFKLYLERLEHSYRAVHKSPLADSAKAAIKDKLASPIDRIYKRVSFFDFMRYALIESDQSLPLISLNYITESLDVDEPDPNYTLSNNAIEEADEALTQYLLTGVITDTLKRSIDTSLAYLRTVMFREISGSWQSVSSRFVKASLLMSYKNDVTEFLNPVVYKAYLLPLVRFESETYKSTYEDYLQFDKNKMMDGVVELGLNPFSFRWGCQFETLHNCLKPRGHKYEYNDGDCVDLTFPIPLNYLPEKELLSATMTDEPALPEDSISDIPYHLKFGVKGEGRVNGEHLYGICESVNSDSILDEDGEASEVYVLPMLHKGAELSKKELVDLATLFRHITDLDKYDNYVLGGFSAFDVNRGGGFAEFLGNAVKGVLDKGVEYFATIFSLDKADLYVIDRDGAYMPFGRERISFFNELYVEAGLGDDYEFTIADHVTDISQFACSKPVFSHTYTNNMIPLDEWDVEYSHLMNCDPLAYETGCKSVAVIIDDITDMVKQLPFNKCRNVYAISCDRGNLDDPTVIAGFDEDGKQVLNISQYTFNPSYHGSYWDLQAALFSSIKEAITGYLYHYSVEFGYPRAHGRYMISTLINEKEVVKKLFSVRGDVVDGRGMGEVHLNQVWVKAPITMSKSEIDLIMRKNLNHSENERGSRECYHSNVLLRSELDCEPSFSLSDPNYRWYSAYSLDEPYRSIHPVIESRVKGQDIFIYQMVTDNRLARGMSLKDCADKYQMPAGMLILTEEYKKLLVAFTAMADNAESLVNIPEQLPSGSIRVNVIADELDKIEFNKLLEFAKSS